MLSKVAERVYWLARYVERIENTARLVKVHSQLMLDLPKSVKLNWYSLVQITSNEDYFLQKYNDERSEKNCIALLLSDRDNPASLMSSLWWARENIRTTRDILPREAWIQINELYVMVNKKYHEFENRTSRNELLSKIIHACQAFNGMLSSTMSDNETYRFLKLGLLIERADMSTRLVDEGGLFVSQEQFVNEDAHFEHILWANLLRSMNSYFMYRQKYQTEISGQEVLEFLTKDTSFARSVSYCLLQMQEAVAGLPNSQEINKALDALCQQIQTEKPSGIGSLELHSHLDWIQGELSLINQMLYGIWFNPKQVA